MVVEGKELYFERGEAETLELEFTDDNGDVAEIQSVTVQIYTVEDNTVVYTANSAEIDVAGLDAGVYWYQVDAETDLGKGRIGPARLYVMEGKENEG